MTHDPLHDLLAHADDSTPVPAMKPGLMANIEARARHRAMRRQVLPAVAAIVVMGFGIARLMPHGSRTTGPHQADVDVAAIRAEIKSLDVEARREQRRANELLHNASISTIDIVAAYPSQPDPLDRINAARDRAALILLRQADRAQIPAEGEEIRSSIVRLFPETPAGQIAQRRLKPAGSSI